MLALLPRATRLRSYAQKRSASEWQHEQWRPHTPVHRFSRTSELEPTLASSLQGSTGQKPQCFPSASRSLTHHLPGAEKAERTGRTMKAWSSRGACTRASKRGNTGASLLQGCRYSTKESSFSAYTEPSKSQVEGKSGGRWKLVRFGEGNA